MSSAVFVPDFEELFSKKTSDDPLERKLVEDFRDRAAYVYITGSFPTHLRRYFMALLRKATNYSAVSPAALDNRSGAIHLRPEIVTEAELQNHPMVKKTKEFIREGYRIQQSRGFAERRPYSRVFLFKQNNIGLHKVTVKADGSVKQGWD